MNIEDLILNIVGFRVVRTQDDDSRLDVECEIVSTRRFAFESKLIMENKYANN